jgi:pSer/pThr/pTyr-binding forkhead associated (FHA) protein
MPVIQVKDKEQSLKPGQTRVGAGPGVDISVSDDAAHGVQAILELGSNNAAVIRRASDTATVKVNGVTLGVEPTPLIHGDKVEILGIELRYSDDKKVGATQFVSSSDVSAAAAKRAGPARATTATGGRIVSLVDGKEYQIPSNGVTFGREAGSDVVVPQPEVSRRHASIAPAQNGYILKDHSTNGVWVNGTRVQGSQLLSRADVVRVGSEEFRFYADMAPARPTPAASTPAAPSPTPAPASPPPKPAPSATPLPVTAPRSAKPEPTTSPRGSAVRTESRAKKESSSAARTEEKRSGISPWIWVLIIAIVAVAAYFFGQVRG